MTTTTIRRTAALTTTVAALALPGAAMAMPAPDTGYTAPSGGSTPTVSSPSSSGNDDTLAVVLASGALAIALGGVAYSVKLSAGEHGALKAP
jgi:hypothetical protein